MKNCYTNGLRQLNANAVSFKTHWTVLIITTSINLTTFKQFSDGIHLAIIQIWHDLTNCLMQSIISVQKD